MSSLFFFSFVVLRFDNLQSPICAPRVYLGIRPFIGTSKCPYLKKKKNESSSSKLLFSIDPQYGIGPGEGFPSIYGVGDGFPLVQVFYR